MACAGCIEGYGPVHPGVHGIVQSAIALGATVEIIGTAKCVDSVRKEHGDLALAESYPDNGPYTKEFLETFVEYILRPRRWHPF